MLLDNLPTFEIQSSEYFTDVNINGWLDTSDSKTAYRQNFSKSKIPYQSECPQAQYLQGEKRVLIVGLALDVRFWLSPDPAGQFFNPFGTSGDWLNNVDPDGRTEYLSSCFGEGCDAATNYGFSGGSGPNGFNGYTGPGLDDGYVPALDRPNLPSFADGGMNSFKVPYGEVYDHSNRGTTSGLYGDITGSSRSAMPFQGGSSVGATSTPAFNTAEFLYNINPRNQKFGDLSGTEIKEFLQSHYQDSYSDWQTSNTWITMKHNETTLLARDVETLSNNTPQLSTNMLPAFGLRGAGQASNKISSIILKSFTGGSSSRAGLLAVETENVLITTKSASSLKNVSGGLDDAANLARNQPYGPVIKQFRRVPKSAQEVTALKNAQAGMGRKIIDNLSDPRFKGMEKWHYSFGPKGSKSVVHYVRDPKTGRLMDFKFK